MLVLRNLSKYNTKTVIAETKEVLLIDFYAEYINGIAQGFMRRYYAFQNCIYYYKNNRTIVYKYSNGKMRYMSVGGIKLSYPDNFITLPNRSTHDFNEDIIKKVNAACKHIKLMPRIHIGNSYGNIFSIITNEGPQDRLLMATAALMNRMR